MSQLPRGSPFLLVYLPAHSCLILCRAEIEADYAKRLGKLAKVAVGKDETGATKAALDVVRAELDMTSRVHTDLSAMIRKDLEGSLAEFQSKTASARKNSVATIDKLFKNKQAQENYVNKSRERYEQDCIKINGYTAQSSLVQGRDLDKVTSKLDKAQSTVATNDKDYQNFVRALKDTTFRWNGEWKTYLDQCQDLEEDRLEFIKSNLWNYANALSAVCVADDEGCERVRVALENCETSTDIADFIQYRGTGPAIPDPPEYINYAKGQPPPARPSFKTANFQRTTTRTAPPPAPPSQTFVPPTHQQPPPQQHQQPPPQQPTSRDSRNDPPPPPPSAGGPSGGAAEVAIPRRNGMSPSRQQPPINGQTQNNTASQPPSTDKAERRMSTKNFLARTPSVRGAPEGQASAADRTSQPNPVAAAPTASSAVDEDPIAKALANLRARPGGRSPGPNSPAQMPPAASSSSVPTRHSQQPPPNDRRISSQAPPRSPSPSVSGGMHRPSSPAAAFMQAPQAPSSPIPVEEVLGSYGQSFPGERRRSVSRQNSVASGISSRSQAGAGKPQESGAVDQAGPNTDGFAGVGARGRSPSPQPFGRPASRQQQGRPTQQNVPPSSSGAAQRHSVGQPNMSASGAPQHPPQRSTTPLGISLDASGSVTHDQMAQEYMRRTGSVPPPQQQQPQQQRPPSQMQNHQHRMSQQYPHQQPYYGQPPPQTQQAPQRPASVVYGGQQQQQPGGGYQGAPSQMSTGSSAYTITPSTYGGQQPPPPQQQGYYAAHQQQPSGAPGHYGQPPQFSHQDSTNSLGRASGYGYSQHQPQPSASQSLHGSMSQQGTPAPTGTPAPGHQYGASSAQETAASAYMHQYQRQHAPPASSSTPGPYGQQGWGQPQQPQQPVGTSPGIPHPQQGYSHPPQQQQQQPAAPQQQAPPPASPAPAPTGQYSDAGKPILFYVKAMYDYSATTDEEFSFTTGDIIAVTQTDPDGWWQGELLDEARRRRGATTFPSNFTTLLQ